MNDINTDLLDADSTTLVPGSWQETLHKSATLNDRSKKGLAKASSMLWEGAQEGITSWLVDSDTDVSGENLRAEIIGAMGKSRKGDASKIVTVALAVKAGKLTMSLYPSLTKAYNEAQRLAKTVPAQQQDDEAADKAVEDIVSQAPKSSSTPEGAALIVLSKGVDEAARLLLDALGVTNEAAHRALLRAISQEAAGRIVKPVKPVKVAGPKKGATAAKPGGASPKAAVKTATTKAKPVKAEAAGDVVKVEAAAAPVKAKPVQAKAAESTDEILAEIEAEGAEGAAPAAPVVKAKRRAVPVRRPA